MIGTLVGLVQMLSNMSDPKSIGPAMAVALLTTLYGAMIANMFALPVSDKLALRSQEEQMNKVIIIESILGIQDGQNPKVLEEILNNFLPKSSRDAATETDVEAEAVAE
jgi:chemotaxis protein MotA